MREEIEIEFKNMVTKEEFQTLCDAFHIKTFTTQINHYFETPDFSLRNAGSALRIREKNSTYMLTLKQPAKIGLLETHQSLTKAEAKQIIQTGVIPDGTIAIQLENLGIPRTLTYYGCLSTERAEMHYQDGLLVFDHSFYFEHDDYELEYEVTDEEKKEDFLSLLRSYNIPIRSTQNKVQRFFLAKQQNDD
ncbi:CYTH domain-containing protein [Ectobacillus antri]|uniref:CYTH domain-containing protein n=1 Tax=Ectobacillus antri TaxID=2486280 RepID=UPI000F5A1C5D|nr:CYTH domain-containing protein [Ectobacillus antri]